MSTDDLGTVYYAPAQRRIIAPEHKFLTVGVDTNILCALLEGLPYLVRYCPHHDTPQDLSNAVASHCSTHTRFRYNLGTHYAKDFAKQGLALVTDFSRLAVAFALITGRRSVFYNPLAFDMPDDIRPQIGLVADNLANLVKAVANICQSEPVFVETIYQYTHGTIVSMDLA